MIRLNGIYIWMYIVQCILQAGGKNCQKIEEKKKPLLTRKQKVILHVDSDPVTILVEYFYGDGSPLFLRLRQMTSTPQNFIKNIIFKPQYLPGDVKMAPGDVKMALGDVKL